MDLAPLSRREREIMDVLYRHGQATARTVQREIDDPPSYSAVRATLRVLEEKGHVSHRRRGRSYLYEPAVAAPSARDAAVKRLVDVFFGGSTANAILAMIDERAANLDDAEIARIEAMIEEAREEGR
ncbi:MAG: BlaI/MecI/CopY family transcriptional regulator [Thermomicrobiales bacterium]